MKKHEKNRKNKTGTGQRQTDPEEDDTVVASCEMQIGNVSHDSDDAIMEDMDVLPSQLNALQQETAGGGDSEEEHEEEEKSGELQNEDDQSRLLECGPKPGKEYFCRVLRADLLLASKRFGQDECNECSILRVQLDVEDEPEKIQELKDGLQLHELRWNFIS